MKTLTYKIEIQAGKDKVWESLWDKENYTKWTKPFSEGLYIETESFSEGSEIRFFAPNGDAMISKIINLQPREYVAFEHLSMMQNGEISSFNKDGETNQFFESYRLIDNESSITLVAKVNTLESEEKSMDKTFPKALQIVKELSEQ
nr:SRPBCC domain-containing protein [uncultured Allomuricauda sp.]